MKTSGWIVFASVMMVLIGMFMIVDALIALINDEVYLVTENQLVAFDFTTWGWIHLVIGSIVMLGGFALTSGALWARLLGVLLAVGSAVSQVGLIQAYPFWSLLIVFFNVMVIYALLVHGSEDAATI